MHRRDLSAMILASAAGSTVLSKYAQAQTCTPPCYPQTPAETAAKLITPFTIVNYTYPPLCVDRYVTNSTPAGTVDMTPGFNAAIAVAMIVSASTAGAGTVTWGATAPYLCLSPINATYGGNGNLPGIILQNVGGRSHDLGNGILAKHTGVAVFDCTGNDSITFKDVVIHTDTSTFPKTGILFARNSNKESQINHLERCSIVGYFGVANFYNYGSEDGEYLSNYLHNQSIGSNTKVAIFTANNVFGLSSAFTTDPLGNTIAIATGTCSTSEHNWIGNQVWNTAGQSNSDCIYLEQAWSFRSYGGYGFCASRTASGRALFFIDGSVGPTHNLTIDGFDGDTATYQQNYGISVSNNAQPHLGWSIRGCRFPNTSLAIAVDELATIDRAVIDYIAETEAPTLKGNGIEIAGTLQNSTLNINDMVLGIGTSTNNRLSGFAENWSIGTRSNDIWFDQGTAHKTFSPTLSGVTFGGTPTTRYKCTYHDNFVTFNIVWGASSITCPAGATIGAMPGAATDVFVFSVVNIQSGALIGYAYISGSTITLPAISVTTATVVISGTYAVA